MSDELELRKALDAANDAYNRGDAEGWLGPGLEGAVVFQGSTQAFIPLTVLRSAAEAILSLGGRFSVEDVQCRIVGDTAVQFGTFENQASPDAVPERGSFSITYARVDGEWRPLFSHYTPTSRSEP